MPTPDSKNMLAGPHTKHGSHLLNCPQSIIRRRNSLFGHVARLTKDLLAHQALQCHIDLSLGQPLIEAGDVFQSETGGSTKSARRTVHHLLTFADEQSYMVTRG